MSLRDGANAEIYDAVGVLYATLNLLCATAYLMALAKCVKHMDT